MRVAGAAFAILAMLIGTGALIAFLDWISRNIDDAIDHWPQGLQGDLPVVPEEVGPAHVGDITQ
jgi:hypothetical protein